MSNKGPAQKPSKTEAKYPPRTKEEALAQLIEKDPQKAAEILRQILAGKSED